MSSSAKRNMEEELVKKFRDLHFEATKRGASADEVALIFRKAKLSSSDTGSNKGTQENKYTRSKKSKYIYLGVIALVCAILVGSFIQANEITSFQDALDYFTEWRCVIDNNGFVVEIARPPLNCDVCRDLYTFPVEKEISQERFLDKYAYTSVPVLIKDATKNWTAMSTFSYDFFKELYSNTNGSLKLVEEECQFFPYKTEFDTLADVFNISVARARFEPGERNWYIGWSNCHPLVASILRQHYHRPYFLPNDSESSSLDWIFMGGSGRGAYIHLDYVQRPSWQAQIVGKKTWSLYPVPECEHICHEINATMEKGDISK
ncbi:hypothetical protein CHS0354_028283 [Potamilus streckersoni]|uniref:Cupin-like domain-containing protein n=1 Tax=Potamilus streckersoni TaxID=2493646 RepID=A0AAE0RTR7_9BIVA|nr:hypothetical protein CHS0354_028283 [Potamilus streckersoni]